VKRLLALVALAALAVPAFSTAAFADAALTAKFVNEDGPHCVRNGTASRGHLVIRTKASMPRGAITTVSDVWTQTSVVGAQNSWLVRLRAPRPAPASIVRVFTPIGSIEVSVPRFDTPCPVPPQSLTPQGASGAGSGAASGASGSAVLGAATNQAAAKPVVRSAAPTSGSLPLTGMGTIQLLPVAALFLCLGTLMLAGPRRRVRPEALRYDGRFLADG
jgi:hypothetical protein